MGNETRKVELLLLIPVTHGDRHTLTGSIQLSVIP